MLNPEGYKSTCCNEDIYIAGEKSGSQWYACSKCHGVIENYKEIMDFERRSNGSASQWFKDAKQAVKNARIGWQYFEWSYKRFNRFYELFERDKDLLPEKRRIEVEAEMLALKMEMERRKQDYEKRNVQVEPWTYRETVKKFLKMEN